MCRCVCVCGGGGGGGGVMISGIIDVLERVEATCQMK